MSNPIFTTPSPAAQNLELLRQHFPQAIETDAQGRIRINAAAMQLAVDPANPAGVQVEEDGFELRWVGKREAYHSAFVPVQKIVDGAQALYLVVETKGYENPGDIPTKERWKIDSAKRFFEALRQQGTPVEFHTKLNRDSLAQIIHQIGR